MSRYLTLKFFRVGSRSLQMRNRSGSSSTSSRRDHGLLWHVFIEPMRQGAQGLAEGHRSVSPSAFPETRLESELNSCLDLDNAISKGSTQVSSKGQIAHPTLLESVVVNTRLVQLQQRIRQLETLAEELVPLVEGYYRDDNSGDANLGRKGQQWLSGCRELLVQNKLSSLAKLRGVYRSSSDDDYHNLEPVLSAKSRRNIGMRLTKFGEGFRKARSLVCASEDELISRELPVRNTLSFAVAENEFAIAENLVNENRSNEVMIRAGGVIGGVTLQRHLWTVADSRALTVVKNPPTKKVADVSDLLATLVKETVLTQIQRSQLDGLFAIANNCATIPRRRFASRTLNGSFETVVF